MDPINRRLWENYGVSADLYWAQNSPLENAEEVIIEDLNRSQLQHLLQACI